VQVKLPDSPVDSPTLNQLIGSIQNVHAELALQDDSDDGE
jgi:hypothetical protein